MAHGDAVICRLEEAERELAQIAGLEGGRLRLASFPTASATLMTRALSLFRQRFPKVELEFTEDEPEDSFPGAEAGRLRPRGRLRLPGLPTRLLPRRRGRADLRGADARRAAARASARGRQVGADRGSRRRGLALRRACRAPAATRCSSSAARPASSRRISFQSEDYEVIKGFVAGGLGVTILPELAGGHPGIELRPVRGTQADSQGVGGDARERGALARRRGDAGHPARGLPRLPRRPAPAVAAERRLSHAWLHDSLQGRRRRFGARQARRACESVRYRSGLD